ncbi:hypothetical protein ACQKPX_05060 [Photobacterium sp. DNB23_23_1]|uniref:DUF3347 domain-containing protein n=1 Tax=Photobacterium pectinilyticum TaxID=2906793 RepID=A0ABT1N8N3_9GAMM|nr:hypothetical protein [Photobacterium sp. ZSDE20]MCQ1061113.1 hypothetical protein [Photobacterium sp. ZSDE20]MDD1829280.1 hypothetical protein [Photobacterium sp. ZSDE20]
MKNALLILLAAVASFSSATIHAAQHDHDTLFSRDNAVMAAAAVETVNKYCVDLGTMPTEYLQKTSLVMRETIEGLSVEILGEEFSFSEDSEMYLEGMSMGEQLIKDAEHKGHVEQMCTLPQQEKSI